MASDVEAENPAASVLASPRSYRHIRIISRRDINATYPLICAYVKNPSLALTIVQIAVDPFNYMGHTFNPEDQQTDDEENTPVDEDAHAAVEAYARNLGLGDVTTEKMIDALQWKKAEHLKPQYPAPSGFSVSSGKYAYTATTLLLSLCTNLEMLYLGDLGIDHYQSPILPRPLDLNTPLENYLLYNNYGKLTEPGLQKLKHVRYMHVEEFMSGGCYTEFDFLVWLRCFHRLPALERVSMDGAMNYQRVTRDFFPPKTGNFTSLHVTHADIDAAMLGTMIRASKALEEFVLSLGGLYFPDGGAPASRFPTLGKCLFEHRGTLKVLDMDIDRHCGSRQPERDRIFDDEYNDEKRYMDELFYMDQADSPGPLWPHEIVDDRPVGFGIGPLDQFPALTHLSISVDALIGWPAVYGDEKDGTFETPFRLIDGLPPSLESLRIYSYTRGMSATQDDHVDELLRTMADRLPNLKNVEGLDQRIDGIKHRATEEEDDMWRPPTPDVGWSRDEE